NGHIHASVDVRRERGGEVPGYLAARAERGIQAAVGVVADHGEVDVARVLGIRHPRQHDLAVRLEANVPGKVPAVIDVGDRLAAAAEGGIQAAIGVVADHGEVAPGAT